MVLQPPKRFWMNIFTRHKLTAKVLENTVLPGNDGQVFHFVMGSPGREKFSAALALGLMRTTVSNLIK